MARGFGIVKGDFIDGLKPHIPQRSTTGSACYDLKSLSSGVIMPNQTVKVRTGIKAYMEQDEVLMCFSRSGMGIKHNIVLANGTGIIDSDYYGNPSNDGEIIVALRNEGKTPFKVEIGDRVCQCMFTKYLGADDDKATGTRTGGFGSTGK